MDDTLFGTADLTKNNCWPEAPLISALRPRIRSVRLMSCAHAVLWLLLLTGEMMKWAHLSDFQVNCIAAAQLTLTSGVAGVVLIAVAWGLTRKAAELFKKWWPVRFAPPHGMLSCSACLL